MSQLRTAIAGFLTILGLGSLLAAPAAAQVWNEIGDAGQTIATAQSTAGTGALSQINGSLSSASDVDIYCVQVGPAVRIPGLPVFALQCVANQGPNIWVFDSNGVGIAMNETCQGGTKLLSTNTVPTGGPVTMYVAVSYYGVDPFTATGSIWQPGNPGERSPDGADPSGALALWQGVANVQPLNPYSISVGSSGVVTAFCETPVSTEARSWGALKGRHE